MKRILVVLTFIMSSLALAAQDAAYERKVFTSSEDQKLNYRLLKPSADAEEKKFPLVLFLHGAGERGSDNEKQMIHGSQMFLNPVNREKFPAYVIIPQCPEDGYWAYSTRPASCTALKAEKEMPPVFKAVKELVDYYLQDPSVDRSRVYIMGLSMGAMATYDMVVRFPEIFAAAIPICGAVERERLKDIKGVSFRIYHGDADKVVPVDCSREAYMALKEAGVKVEFYEFPGCGHISWNLAFSQPDFMEWLFAQKRKVRRTDR